MGLGGFLSGDFAKVMSNPLLQQYMAAIGGGLATGGLQGGVQAASNTTQQNIQTQNYMKLIKAMLAGDLSGGGKLTMDKDGMKITIPKLQGEGEAPVRMDSPAPAQPSTPSLGMPSQGSILSPFASGQLNFSASDLAGLNPEMISQALQLKMMQDNLKLKTIESAQDEAHRVNLDKYYAAQIKNIEADNAAAQAESLRKWLETLTKDERTELQKNYEYAKEQGFEGSLLDFKNSGGSPTSVEEFEYATKNQGFKGTYLDFLKKYKGPMTIQLGEFEKTMLRGQAQAQLDVLDPDFVSKTTKELSQATDWDVPEEAAGRSEDIPKYQRLRLIKSMDDKIRRAFEGHQVERKIDGWYVDGKKRVRMP